MPLLCLFLCYLSYTELIKGQMFDVAPPPLCRLWRSALLLLSLTTYLKEWPENLSSETSQLTERRGWLASAAPTRAKMPERIFVWYRYDAAKFGQS